MTVPPYVVACLICILMGYAGDRLKTRGIFMIGHICIALVGFLMNIASTNNNVKYAGIFFITAGVYPNVPQGIAWNENNIGGSTKRGIGMAMHVAFGNIGGIIASYIYRAPDAPRYFSGRGSLIGLQCMSLTLSVFMTLYLRRENKRRDAEHKAPALYTEDEKAMERQKGDYASFFRYVV